MSSALYNRGSILNNIKPNQRSLIKKGIYWVRYLGIPWVDGAGSTEGRLNASSNVI